MVTAVIVNYRTSHLLGESIPVILKDPAILEVIVVDNSCDPDEYARLRRLKARFSFRLFVEDNIGFGRACNKGLETSKTPWVFLMNGDVIPEEGSIGVLLEEATKVGAHIAGPALFMKKWDFFTPPFNGHSPLWLISSSELVLHTPLRWVFKKLYDRFFTKFSRAKEPVKVDFLPGAALLVRKGSIGFDPRFFLLFEDLDLCKRARRKRLKIFFCPRSRMVHLLSESFGGLNGGMHYRISREIFQLKWGSPRLAKLVRDIKTKSIPDIKPLPDTFLPGLHRISPNPFFVPYTIGVIESTEEFKNILKKGFYVEREVF